MGALGIMGQFVCYEKVNSCKTFGHQLMKFSYIFSKPLDLVSFQEQIKADGINCPLNKLVDFLDHQVRNRPFAGKVKLPSLRCVSLKYKIWQQFKSQKYQEDLYETKLLDSKPGSSTLSLSLSLSDSLSVFKRNLKKCT